VLNTPPILDMLRRNAFPDLNFWSMDSGRGV
jgi:hypothetical protein